MPSLTFKERLQKEMKGRIVVSKMKKPKFHSEGAEANWYDAHPEYIEAFFKQAMVEGKLGRGTAASVMGLTTPVTIRFDTEDLAKAKRQAKQKGVGYQTYIKMLLREALAAARKRAA